MSAIVRHRLRSTVARRAGRRMLLVPPYGKTINTYLPIELMKEIFLYSIESTHMQSGQLASVCRYWRAVIATMSHLWSTLTIGTWTETAQVTTWLQRAYPKQVIIDTERDVQGLSNTLPFSALQGALASSDRWHELTIVSFPSENVASLDYQVAGPMKELKSLRVVAGCVHSSSLARFLKLLPTDASLRELRFHPSPAGTHAPQSHWSVVMKNLTVLIVSGRDIDEPSDLLPTFTQLQIFEANCLRLPSYEPSTNIPLLSTLRKLQLRACSVQWMAGRCFPRLEECAILLPRHWGALQQHEVQLPSCNKLSYHGYPMTTVQYFHVPEVEAMVLRSHDCNSRRVHQQLHFLCTVNEWIPKLTTLHLTLQCSEQALINVLVHSTLLHELIVSIAHPSPSWQSFLESLAAIPHGNDWFDQEMRMKNDQEWKIWCSSRTWHVSILPNLKYLGIQCPKGFSQSECLDNLPFLRLVGWTRAQVTPRLVNLKVWEGRGTTDDIAVDYISTHYLDKHLGISGVKHDIMVVRAMVTKDLRIYSTAIPVFRLHSTILFRHLQLLVVDLNDSHATKYEFPALPYLEQIKRLEISFGIIPAYSLKIDLPLTRTLQWLRLYRSTIPWMIGRSFKALREFHFTERQDDQENPSRHEGLHVHLPVCTKLDWTRGEGFLRFFSCPSLQIFHFSRYELSPEALHQSLPNFLCNCPCLQQLEIRIPKALSWADSLIRFVLCDAREQGVWRDIGSVHVWLSLDGSSRDFVRLFFSQMVGRQQHYEKWWKEVAVTKFLFKLVIIKEST